MTRAWIAVAFLVSTGCARGVSGEVRDALTDRPVAGAEVVVATSGWGTRGGGLVWDKETLHRATTGGDGTFRLSGADGGYRLAVRAAGFRPLQTALCSQSPTIIRVGGPFDGADLGKSLLLGRRPGGPLEGWRFADAAMVAAPMADLMLTAWPGQARSIARLAAPGGLAFRRGTGNPPAPPATGYARELAVDLLDCGWLFVRTAGGAIVPVKIGSFGVDQPPEGGRMLMLTYAALPAG